MKNRKYKSNGPTKHAQPLGRIVSQYEPSFKKQVILYAEEKSTSEAQRHYGISQSNIRRWRRLKTQILEKASEPMKNRRRRMPFNAGDFCEEDSFDNSNASLDSMPLQQRLSQKPEPSQPVLQSQPLSPTKLKVTRQGARPPVLKAITPDPPNDEVCLRWNSHHANIQSTFPNLLLREQYVDATLVSEGQTLKCHRLVLSSCSPYFEQVLNEISPLQHPVLFMRDVPFWILKALCDFMYAGEVHIFQNKLEELLQAAEALQIKGLAGKPDTKEELKPLTSAPVKEERDSVLPPRLKEVKETKEDKKKVRQHREDPPKLSPKPPISRPAHSHSLRRLERNRDRTSLKKDNINDPLDLLEPVYEEITKEPQKPKPKEPKHVPVKKNVNKKVKKRKYVEEKEESPPPMFHSRKGTRSRPNVKVPKFFHSHFEAKETTNATIVREPHTDHDDPLIQVEDIKAEPLDVEDAIIDVDDSLVSYMDQEMATQEEEIIASYDSPIVNLKSTEVAGFNKIQLVSQPVIMSVHSVTEGKDPLEVQEKSLSEIMISNVQSVVDDLTSSSDEKKRTDIKSAEERRVECDSAVESESVVPESEKVQENEISSQQDSNEEESSTQREDTGNNEESSVQKEAEPPEDQEQQSTEDSEKLELQEDEILTEDTQDLSPEEEELMLSEGDKPSKEPPSQEEDLLDFDDDMIMKEASTSEKCPEKTLEMIVNDLNESLGEIRKDGSSDLESENV